MSESTPTPGAGRPVLVLFCGLPGAGKTTLARRLEAAGRGVRLCTDEWQADVGVPPRDGEFHELLQARLRRHALELLRRGVDVVLEDGLWLRAERDVLLADARAAGARVELHVFDVPREVLWERLQRRRPQGAPGSLPHDPGGAGAGVVAVRAADAAGAGDRRRVGGPHRRTRLTLTVRHRGATSTP